MKRWLAALLAAVLVTVHAADAPLTPEGASYSGSLRDGKPNGRGRLEWPNGARYEGTFDHGVVQGRGTLVRADGATYSGEFSAGRFDGRGRLALPGGEVYEGDFDQGEFTGHGTWSRPDGARYRGEFVKGRMHGEGRYVDGRGEIYEGEFVEGEFKPLAEERRLLASALSGVAPGRRGAIDLYLLAVGGDASQEVFRREVEFVRAQFDERFGTRRRSVVLVNSRSSVGSAPMASVATIGEALKVLGQRMDRDEDILFLFLTSHGTPTHELKLQNPRMTVRDLPARELADLIRASGIRWKVIVVSACYSGGFIDALKDDATLVITAARRDRSSFGCADGNDFTWFGRAFFKEALPASRTFHDAFAKADGLVAEWERKEQPKEPRSLPQLHSTPAIEAQLERWTAQERDQRPGR